MQRGRFRYAPAFTIREGLMLVSLSMHGEQVVARAYERRHGSAHRLGCELAGTPRQVVGVVLLAFGAGMWGQQARSAQLVRHEAHPLKPVLSAWVRSHVVHSRNDPNGLLR